LLIRVRKRKKGYERERKEGYVRKGRRCVLRGSFVFLSFFPIRSKENKTNLMCSDPC